MQRTNDSHQDKPLPTGRVSEGAFASSPERQQSEVKQKATQAAYVELARLNAMQEKVTEEELRSHATAAAVASSIADYPLSYGEPDEAMRLFLEIYMQTWRDGGAVVSLLELMAIRQAQQEKRKDAVRGWEVSDTALLAKARASALVYVIEDKVMRESLQSTEPPAPTLTPEQQKQCDLYADTYVKYYQLYKIKQRKKFLGLF